VARLVPGPVTPRAQVKSARVPVRCGCLGAALGKGDRAPQEFPSGTRYWLAYPRPDSPDRPPTTGRNYLQPQQIISSQSRKLHADITELPQPLEVPPAPSHGFAISWLSCSAKSLSLRIVSMRSSGALRTVGADANLLSDAPVISAGNFLDHQGLCGAFAASYGWPD